MTMFISQKALREAQLKMLCNAIASAVVYSLALVAKLPTPLAMDGRACNR